MLERQNNKQKLNNERATTTDKLDKSIDEINNGSCSNSCKVMDIMYNTEIFYLYQMWGGKNNFLSKGYFITGPSYKPFILSLLLVLIPSIFCMIFYKHSIIITAVLTVIVVYFKFRISFCDPGIVPRIENYAYDNDDEIKLIPQNNKFIPLGGVMLTNSTGQSAIYKICESCNIYKNKDRKHCRKCDNCVSEFDHHCVWLNNCIGQRNYSSFIIYLIFLIILIAHIIAVSVEFIIKETKKREEKYSISQYQATNQVLSQQPLSIILIILGAVFISLVSALLLFHIYLLFKDLTTAEYRKGYPYLAVQNFEKYFPHSLFQSIQKKFSFISKKSYIDFRQKYIFRTKREIENNNRTNKLSCSDLTPQPKDGQTQIGFSKINEKYPISILSISPIKNNLDKNAQNTASLIKSIDNTILFNVDSNRNILQNSANIIQSTSTKNKQILQNNPANNNNNNNGNVLGIQYFNKTTDQVQTVFINQNKVRNKQFKLPSLKSKQKNKQSNSFMKCEIISNILTPTHSLKELSEINKINSNQDYQIQIQNYYELSGIDTQKNQSDNPNKQINQTVQLSQNQSLQKQQTKLLPSPSSSIQSKPQSININNNQENIKQYNEENENEIIEDNSQIEKNSNLDYENDIVQVSYITDNLYD